MQKKTFFLPNKYIRRTNSNLSSDPWRGFLGSGSLFNVLQPFKPRTVAAAEEACIMIVQKTIMALSRNFSKLKF